MIYNLTEYLMTKFPAEAIRANIRGKLAGTTQVPERIAYIQETGGSIEAWLTFATQSIQIITRDVDVTGARTLAFLIFDEINSTFGLILPAVTVDGELHPQIQVAQISANSLPQCLGDDANGRVEFSTNYRVLYRKR